MTDQRPNGGARTDPNRDAEPSDDGRVLAGGVAEPTPPAGVADAATECLLTVDEDGDVVYANSAVEATLGYAPDAVVGTSIETLLPPTRQPNPGRYRRATAVPAWQDADVYGERCDGEEVPLRATVSELSGDDGALAVALREAAEADCEEHLATLSRITDQLRKVLRAAVGATNRDQLEREVCERLTDVDPYAFAWIGERDRARDVLVPRATGGDDDGYLDGVQVSVESDTGPAQRTIRTGEVAVVNEVSNDCLLGPWAASAVEHGFHSIAAVPLCHEETIYGVLVVYADRPDAFDRRERAVLQEIGEAVGLGISALEWRRALIADSLLEVEFAITGEHPLLAVTEDGTDLLLEGVVANTAEEFVFYYTVDGGDPEAVVEGVAGEVGRTKRGRVVEDGDEPLVEWVTEKPTISTILSEFGGTKVAQVVSDGVAYITAELPHGTDVRALNDALEASADGIDGSVELLAQRTTERTTLSNRQFKTCVTERLTDRQLATLRTAYFAGYHDRPRASSGEEVAETLDVSPSTFHQHHRVGVRKLLAAAFECPRDDPDD